LLNGLADTEPVVFAVADCWDGEVSTVAGMPGQRRR
jgi:hypothetical protein